MEELKVVFDGIICNEEDEDNGGGCADECVGGTASKSNMEATQ